MDDLAPVTRPVVVGLPAEIDITNAGDLATQFREAIALGVPAVVADLTATVFCDSSGVRIIVLAHDWAKAEDVELRLAVPPGPAFRVMQLIGLDQLLPIYPSLDQALAAEPIPETGAPPG